MLAAVEADVPTGRFEVLEALGHDGPDQLLRATVASGAGRGEQVLLRRTAVEDGAARTALLERLQGLQRTGAPDLAGARFIEEDGRAVVVAWRWPAGVPLTDLLRQTAKDFRPPAIPGAPPPGPSGEPTTLSDEGPPPLTPSTPLDDALRAPGTELPLTPLEERLTPSDPQWAPAPDETSAPGAPPGRFGGPWLLGLDATAATDADALAAGAGHDRPSLLEAAVTTTPGAPPHLVERARLGAGGPAWPRGAVTTEPGGSTEEAAAPTSPSRMALVRRRTRLAAAAALGVVLGTLLFWATRPAASARPQLKPYAPPPTARP